MNNGISSKTGLSKRLLAEKLGISISTLHTYFKKPDWPDGDLDKMKAFIHDTQTNNNDRLLSSKKNKGLAELKEEKLKIEIEALTEKLTRARSEMKAEIYQELSMELSVIFDDLKEIYSRLPSVYQKELQSEIDKMRLRLCK